MSKASETKAELNKKLIEVEAQYLIMKRRFLSPNIRAEERRTAMKAVNDLEGQYLTLSKRFHRKPRKTR